MRVKKLFEIFDKYFLFIVDVALPLPLYFLMLFLWYRKVEGNILFVVYISLLPTILGYVVPYVGINIFKMWKFNSRFLVKNMYIHHGFLISPYNMLIFYLVFMLYTGYQIINYTIAVIFSAISTGIISTYHDYVAIKRGKIVLCNQPAREGKSTGEIISYFSYIGFAIIGGMYALSCCMAYYIFVDKAVRGALSFTLLFGLGFILTGFVPALLYALKEKDNIGKDFDQVNNKK
jgi:hypothetical protein